MSIPRYVIVTESPGAPNRTQWRCQACAFETIPLGQTRILIDAAEGKAWRVWRQTPTTGFLVRVMINHRYEVTNAYGVAFTLTLLPGEHEGYCAERTVNEAATVASVVAYLKENQDARR